jgi:tripartite-type tricarboxylate transporter receptor subunit TctC
MTTRRAALASTAALLAAYGVPAFAAYPDKPVRLVVPWPPGGASDTASRIVARHLQDRLKTPVIVDNKAGAAGNIGTEAVARSSPDGYTLLLSSGPFSINPSLFRKLPFDTLKDFVPVAQLTTSPSVVVVHPDTPAKTIKDFVKLAGDANKPLAIGTPGNGSAQHLAVELMKKKAGLQFLHVPYKGGTPAIQDLLGGTIPAMMVNLAEAIPHIRSGKMRALAVTTARRTSLLPDVPTLMESGLADASSGGWSGIHAPAGTPPEIVTRLHGEINAILDMPEVREQLSATGFDVRRVTQKEFAEFVVQQIATWKEAVTLSGAQVD